MPSKSKRLRVENERRTFFIRRSRIFPVVFVSLALLGGAWLWISYEQPDQFSQADWDITNTVLGILSKEVSTMREDPRTPIVVRKKLEAVLKDHEVGKLGFAVFAGTPPKEEEHTLMGAEPTGTKPVILIQAKHFMERSKSNSPELFRSTVITALLHEYIHLDMWPLTRELTESETVEEEVRAYSKMCLKVVRPLREAGFVQQPSYLHLDNLLMSCGDNPQCPEFKEAIRKY